MGTKVKILLIILIIITIIIISLIIIGGIIFNKTTKLVSIISEGRIDEAIEVCKKEGEMIKIMCFSLLIKKTKDIALCKNFEDVQEECIMAGAAILEDPKICENLEYESKNICLAVTKKDIEERKKIDSFLIRQMCEVTVKKIMKD